MIWEFTNGTNELPAVQGKMEVKIPILSWRIRSIVIQLLFHDKIKSLFFWGSLIRINKDNTFFLKLRLPLVIVYNA